MNDPATCWFIKQVGAWYHVMGYYEDTDNGMDWHIPKVKEIAEEEGWNLAPRWVGPHDMKQRSKGNGKTLVKECAEYGAKFRVIKKVDQKILSIQASRRLLARCIFDKSGPNMELGLSRLDQYRKEWNKTLMVWHDKPRHDIASNGADALQCFAMAVEEGEHDEMGSQAQKDPRNKTTAIVGMDGKPLNGAQPRPRSRMRGYT